MQNYFGIEALHKDFCLGLTQSKIMERLKNSVSSTSKEGIELLALFAIVKIHT